MALTAREFEVLQFAAFWTFYTVALADGKMSRLERATMANAIEAIRKSSMPQAALLRRVMASISEDLDGSRERFEVETNLKTPIEGLVAARQILETKVPPEEAELFRATLVDIAVAVAAASGPLLGDKVSPEERAAIDLVRTGLGVPATAP